MDRGVLWTAVHGVEKSQTQLSDFHTHTLLSLLQFIEYVLEISVKYFTSLFSKHNWEFFLSKENGAQNSQVHSSKAPTTKLRVVKWEF